MLLSCALIALSLSFSVFACSDDDPAPPADAAAVVDADPNQPDADPNTSIGFLETCDPADDRCDSTMNLMCFPFNNRGPRCTHTCVRDQADDDCEAPSPGCSNMGVCKAP